MEKTLYKVLLFLLFSLAAFDLVLLVLVNVFSANYPHLQPFQLIIGISFLMVTGFFMLGLKKYREQFKASDKD